MEIVDYQCTRTNGRGVIQDKTANCRLTLGGDTVTIDKSSGAKTTITWSVRSTDGADNAATTTCSIEVAKP